MRLSVPEGASYRTKQEFVYRALRDAILRCELAPGQRLMAQSIARQLEVSPIPVREALQWLHSEGLVESRPHLGAVVASIPEESVIEVFTVLEGLEIVGARIAALRMSTEELAELSGLVAEMDVALESGEHEKWGESNARFHITIARNTGMPMLKDMTERVLDRWHRVRRHFFQTVLVKRLVRSQREHRAILAAMRERDLTELERLVKDHNRGALSDYREYMSKNATTPRKSHEASEAGTDTQAAN